MNIKTEHLKKLKERYLRFYPASTISEKSLEKSEQTLSIVFPSDFIEICKFYGGGTLGNYCLFSFEKDGSDYNIVDKTFYYRKCDLSLPDRFVALAETEVSFIVMETKDNSDLESPIILCSIEDAYNLASNKRLEYDPLIFPTFTDFFEYLLDQEQTEREAEKLK